MALFDDIDISAGSTDFTLNGRYLISLPITTGTIVLQITSIIVIDSTHLKVNFNQGASNNIALTTIENYIITPTLTIFDIVPEQVSHPTYVTLTVSEMKNSLAYELDIYNVEAA